MDAAKQQVGEQSSEFSKIFTKLLSGKKDRMLFLEKVSNEILTSQDFTRTIGAEILGGHSSQVTQLLNNVGKHGSHFFSYIPSIHDNVFPGGQYQITPYQIGPDSELG